MKYTRNNIIGIKFTSISTSHTIIYKIVEIINDRVYIIWPNQSKYSIGLEETINYLNSGYYLHINLSILHTTYYRLKSLFI